MVAKERVAAIFIGLIMIFSVAGFALTQSLTRENQDSGVDIQNIVTKPLTSDERLFVLKSGRVLIENHYILHCSECLENNMVLEVFVQKFPGFVVLESVVVNETNETKFQMISGTGEIRDLKNVSITEDILTYIFCEISLMQPRECLLREI